MFSFTITILTEMCVDCQALPENAAKVRKLVEILVGRKDSKLFPAFIKSLRDTNVGLQYVVDELWPDYSDAGNHSLHIAWG